MMEHRNSRRSKAEAKWCHTRRVEYVVVSARNNRRAVSQDVEDDQPERVRCGGGEYGVARSPREIVALLVREQEGGARAQ